MTKISTILIGGLVLAAIVYQILARVPSDALNVALGVLCGIGASIPVSLGLLLALTRQRREERADEWTDPEPVRYVQQPVQRLPQPLPPYGQTGQPQIIVVAPPQGQYPSGQFPQGIPFPAQWLSQQQYPFMQEPAGAVDAREWRIIGED